MKQTAKPLNKNQSLPAIISALLFESSIIVVFYSKLIIYFPFVHHIFMRKKDKQSERLYFRSFFIYLLMFNKTDIHQSKKGISNRGATPLLNKKVIII